MRAVFRVMLTSVSFAASLFHESFSRSNVQCCYGRFLGKIWNCSFTWSIRLCTVSIPGLSHFCESMTLSLLASTHRCVRTWYQKCRRFRGWRDNYFPNRSFWILCYIHLLLYYYCYYYWRYALYWINWRHLKLINWEADYFERTSLLNRMLAISFLIWSQFLSKLGGENFCNIHA